MDKLGGAYIGVSNPGRGVYYLWYKEWEVRSDQAPLEIIYEDSNFLG